MNEYQISKLIKFEFLDLTHLHFKIRNHKVLLINNSLTADCYSNFKLINELFIFTEAFFKKKKIHKLFS